MTSLAIAALAFLFVWDPNVIVASAVSGSRRAPSLRREGILTAALMIIDESQLQTVSCCRYWNNLSYALLPLLFFFLFSLYLVQFSFYFFISVSHGRQKRKGRAVVLHQENPPPPPVSRASDCLPDHQKTFCCVAPYRPACPSLQPHLN